MHPITELLKRWAIHAVFLVIFPSSVLGEWASFSVWSPRNQTVPIVTFTFQGRFGDSNEWLSEPNMKVQRNDLTGMGASIISVFESQDEGLYEKVFEVPPARNGYAKNLL